MNLKKQSLELALNSWYICECDEKNILRMKTVLRFTHKIANKNIERYCTFRILICLHQF